MLCQCPGYSCKATQHFSFHAKQHDRHFLLRDTETTMNQLNEIFDYYFGVGCLIWDKCFDSFSFERHAIVGGQSC